nr:ribosome-inactivating family protein [uncultured Massilia sp.]
MKVQIDLSGRRYAYEDSLRQLRSVLALGSERTVVDGQVRSRRGAGYIQLDVLLPDDDAPSVHLLMRKQNLYIDGFKGANGTWYHFKDAPRPEDTTLGIGVGVRVLALHTGGRHEDLGTHRDDVAFDQASCYQLRVLSAFAGGNDNAIKPALRFAAVVCAEALRFLPVEERIVALLEGDTAAYRPAADWRTYFTRWQQRTGDEARPGAADRTVVVGYQEPPALPVNIGRRR